jgi:hypothetical protein
MFWTVTLKVEVYFRRAALENPTICAQILNEVCPARVPHISHFSP